MRLVCELGIFTSECQCDVAQSDIKEIIEDQDSVAGVAKFNGDYVGLKIVAFTADKNAFRHQNHHEIMRIIFCPCRFKDPKEYLKSSNCKL